MKKYDRIRFIIAAVITCVIFVSAYQVYEVYVSDRRPRVEKPADAPAADATPAPRAAVNDVAAVTDVVAITNIAAARSTDDNPSDSANHPKQTTSATSVASDGGTGVSGNGVKGVTDVSDGGTKEENASDIKSAEVKSAVGGNLGDADSPGYIETRSPRIPRDKYNSLLERNGDVIGWITIEDTNVDYEVMHDGTHYYLDHDIDHNQITAGSIYMDPWNDPEYDDYNTMLHGHNMKNGTMFKDIVKYKDREFFDSHRLIRFDTIYDDMQWEVFSVYVLDADYETIKTRFENDDEFVDVAEGYRARSMFQVDSSAINSFDRILTLSTCSYETPNSRTIVHARLINKNGAQIS